MTVYRNALTIKDIFTCFLRLQQISSVDYSFHYVYGSFDEDRVVPDVVPFLHLLMRDELGVPESQHALVQAARAYAAYCTRPRSLEVLPVGIWTKALGDVLRFGERRVALVQQ